MKKVLFTFVCLLLGMAMFGCASEDDRERIRLEKERKEAQINKASKAQDELSSSIKKKQTGE